MTTRSLICEGDCNPARIPYWPLPWNIVIQSAPLNCSGDVHVFPCPHCNKCKCGGATKAQK